MDTDKSISLRRWMWRAFIQSALIPLILVETVLVAAYLLTNVAIRDAQTEHLRQAALGDLQTAAGQEAMLVSQKLESVGELVALFASQVERVLLTPDFPADEVEQDNLARTDSGVLYSRQDIGRAASFYSSIAAVQDTDRVQRLAQVDGLMEGIWDANSLVEGVYFNTHDSYNRIWPWFHTPDQYPHDMAIPEYNFYYLADAQHNPARGVVWTEMYVDPAGQGWMMSALAPVYRGDFLEGVAGLDITVGNILAQISTLQVPWNGYAMLVSDELNIMVLPKAGEADLDLTEVAGHTYEEAIRREIFKPEDFNLARRDDTRSLAGLLANQEDGVQSVVLGGKNKLAAWATIPETRWRLVTVVDEADIFAQTNELAAHFQRIGLLMIAGLVLFYLIFFAMMSLRSRQLALELQRPMQNVGQMMRAIGAGNWQPQAEPADILELEDMADTARKVGLQLSDLEEQRREALSHLERVLESTTESLWEVDIESQRIRFHGRLPQRLGLASNSLTLMDFFQLIHPQDQIAARESLLPHNGSADLQAQYRLREARGNYLWVLGRGRVEAFDSAGRPSSVAGTHVDISAIKATQEALSTATRQAQAANLAKSRFLSSMSHELRTPLNIIQGFAQLIEFDLENAPEQEKFRSQIQEILKATGHLCLLVDDVLDLARIESERPDVRLEPVDAWQLLEDCARQIRPDAQQAQLDVELLQPRQPVRVMAEPRRLRQVLLNLLSNAVKYNRPGGSITMECMEEDDCWQLRVRDTGLGIDAEQQPLLFKPFQRLGRENGPIKGTGIGLALSRELAGLMNGDLGFSSTDNRGSCFWIRLPKAEDVTPQLPSMGESPERLDVVYVEDDLSSRILVEQALADVASVKLIDNGLEALHRIIEKPPQVLLLDIDLPDMQGDRLLRSLRRSARTRDLPVIVISAGVTLADRDKVSDLDVAMYLTKPLQIQELREGLRQIVRL